MNDEKICIKQFYENDYFDEDNEDNEDENMKKFTADFETTTDIKDCRVWAWGMCEIGNITNYIYGNSIDTFFKLLSNKKENYLCFFHNLKFDGTFIFDYLLNNGYTYIKNKDERRDKTFTCLINEMGVFYSIEVFFEVKAKGKKVNKVTFYDSLKILNFSVEKIAKDFNLPINKLELDYHTKREIGHTLTEHEIAYLRNDVEIMARALEIMFNKGLTKMTIGSNALAFYKTTITNFNNYFPVLPIEIDNDIRASYKGGFTYLSPKYTEKITKGGIVLDVNSMYPAIMRYKSLPIGEPVFFEGKYKEDRLYNLYVQRIYCNFKLKPGKIPSIQIKNSYSFMPNAYLESSNDEGVILTLTNIDLELFFSQYEVYDLEYISGWKFKSVCGLFSEYIDYWSNEKIKSKKENNGANYLISKLMLNNLYGKLGTNPRVISKYPYLDEDKVIRYHKNEEELKEPVYVAVSSFVTSYGRDYIIRNSQKIRDYSLEKYGCDYYVYSDTDSIHTLIEDEEELKSFLDIDDYKLGALKVENRFKRGSYIRQKCYIEELIDGRLNVVVAGLPKKLSNKVNFDNFKRTFTTGGKLVFKNVKGGVVLTNTEFSIK